jgi:uncharacterized protein
MLKSSTYLIPVDFFDEKEKKQKTLVYSTRSNTLKSFPKLVWDRIKVGQTEKFPDIFIKDLKKDHFLLDAGEDERKTLLSENREKTVGSSHLYMAIQPTAACPLGCGYCGQKHENKNMNKDVQLQTIDRINRKISIRKEKGNPYKSLAITWFGAEPLSGFPVIRKLSPEILKIVEEEGIKFSSKIVTNGLLLTPNITHELIHDHKITSYEITLDGTEDFHDARRHTKAHGKTFSKIYEHLLNLANNHEEAQITIRCNVDGRNKDGVSPLLQKLASDGLQDRINFYVAPIHSWGNDAHLISAEKKEFARWEMNWFMEMMELGFNLSLMPTRSFGCFTVSPENELVDPFGEVFSCSEVSLVPTYEKNGKNQYSLGNLNDTPLIHSDSPWRNFYEEETISKYDCWTCPLLPACGGGCPKEWSEGRAPCPPPKQNIKERILLTYVKTRMNDKREAA